MRMHASFPELQGSERTGPSGWERMVHLLLRDARRDPPPEDFEEPFTGLHTREIDEPELFSHLFGGLAT